MVALVVVQVVVQVVVRAHGPAETAAACSSGLAVGSAVASPRMERSSIFPKREQLLRGAGSSCERVGIRIPLVIAGFARRPFRADYPGPVVAFAVPGGDLDLVAVWVKEEHRKLDGEVVA